MFVLKIAIELTVVAIIAYGIWHEEELIELETVLIQWAKRGFKKGVRK